MSDPVSESTATPKAPERAPKAKTKGGGPQPPRPARPRDWSNISRWALVVMFTLALGSVVWRVLTMGRETGEPQERADQNNKGESQQPGDTPTSSTVTSPVLNLYPPDAANGN